MRLGAWVFIVVLFCVLFAVAYCLNADGGKGYWFAAGVAIVSLVFGLVNTFRAELSEFVVQAKVRSIVLTGDTNDGKRTPAFILPVTLVNVGGRSGFLRSMALCVINKESKERLFFRPIVEIDYELFIQEQHNVHGSNVRSDFRGIWIGAGETIFKAILFTYSGDPYSINSGEYEFVLVGLYDDGRGAVELARFERQLDQHLLDGFVSGTTLILSDDDWEKYNDSISSIVGGELRNLRQQGKS